jgi:hypothetical protein
MSNLDVAPDPLLPSMLIKIFDSSVSWENDNGGDDKVGG